MDSAINEPVLWNFELFSALSLNKFFKEQPICVDSKHHGTRAASLSITEA